MADTTSLLSTLPSLRNIEPKSFRVLVAEDDPALRMIVGKSLRLDGYEVHTTAGGEDLLEQVRKLAPDLIVLDLMMPGMDGLTLLSELRRDRQLMSTYVIVLSGKATLDERVEGLELGADDYLTKPAQMK